jgi:hypothetical protein
VFVHCVWDWTTHGRTMGTVEDHGRKENEMQVLQDEAPTVLAEPRAWQALAVEEYARSLPGRRGALRADLAARVLMLTGRLIPADDIPADERAAAVGVDGATFRLYRGGDLVLAKTCAYCGTGHFESPGIGDLADLGYALSAWQPRHENCEDFSSVDLAEW